MNLGKNLLAFMGIERDDKEARMRHYLNMYRFFEAPAVVYLVVDSDLNEPYSCLDIGSIGTTICYAAMAHGLGTIYLAASMHFPDIVKRVLDIPEKKKIVIGIAIGYPNRRCRPQFLEVTERHWKKFYVSRKVLRLYKKLLLDPGFELTNRRQKTRNGS